MNSIKECVFCRIGKKGLLEELPRKSGDKTVPCKRGIYEDNYCIATLAPEQYTKGHTLLISKNHRTDITDSNISSEELSGFISALNKLARHLKEKLHDHNCPQRIYIAILCDGVEHLHAHLIPRYPFTDIDQTIYKQEFLKRGDDIKEIESKILKSDLGGFWYIAEREKNYKNLELWNNRSDEERAEYIEELAKKLRMSLI